MNMEGVPWPCGHKWCIRDIYRCMLAKTEFVANFYVYVYMMLVSDLVYDYMCLFTFHSGADLDRLNNKQLTPSHLAVSMGRLEAIRLLVQLGANVDKPGK